MKKKIISFTSIFFIILLLNSCASTSSVAKKITIKSGEIPPDMKTDNFTLIGVLKGKRSYDKYVEKEFLTYTGKYVLATEEEISNKYNDIEKYRYLMDYHMEDTYSTYYNKDKEKYGPPYETKKSTGFRYYILDRKEKKEYIRKSKSGFFTLEMKAYLIAIDSIRKKNNND